MQPHECMEVWDLLDDGDGLLTVEEFTNGLRRMKGGARSKDILDMLKRLRTSLSQAEALQHDVECLGDSMEDLQQEIGDLSNDLSIVSEVCQVLTEAFGVRPSGRSARKTRPAPPRRKATPRKDLCRTCAHHKKAPHSLPRFQQPAPRPLFRTTGIRKPALHGLSRSALPL